jgi:hypothetical protein
MVEIIFRCFDYPSLFGTPGILLLTSQDTIEPTSICPMCPKSRDGFVLIRLEAYNARCYLRLQTFRYLPAHLMRELFLPRQRIRSHSTSLIPSRVESRGLRHVLLYGSAPEEPTCLHHGRMRPGHLHDDVLVLTIHRIAGLHRTPFFFGGKNAEQNS